MNNRKGNARTEKTEQQSAGQKRKAVESVMPVEPKTPTQNNKRQAKAAGTLPGEQIFRIERKKYYIDPVTEKPTTITNPLQLASAIQNYRVILVQEWEALDRHTQDRITFECQLARLVNENGVLIGNTDTGCNVGQQVMTVKEWILKHNGNTEFDAAKLLPHDPSKPRHPLVVTVNEYLQNSSHFFKYLNTRDSSPNYDSTAVLIKKLISREVLDSRFFTSLLRNKTLQSYCQAKGITIDIEKIAAGDARRKEILPSQRKKWFTPERLAQLEISRLESIVASGNIELLTRMSFPPLMTLPPQLSNTEERSQKAELPASISEVTTTSEIAEELDLAVFQDGSVTHNEVDNTLDNFLVSGQSFIPEPYDPRLFSSSLALEKKQSHQDELRPASPKSSL